MEVDRAGEGHGAQGAKPGAAAGSTAEFGLDGEIVCLKRQRCMGINFREVVIWGTHGICDEPIVSSAIIGNCHPSIFDADLTQVMQKRMVEVVSRWDNEWGYGTRVEEMIGCLAAMDGLASS